MMKFFVILKNLYLTLHTLIKKTEQFTNLLILSNKNMDYFINWFTWRGLLVLFKIKFAIFLAKFASLIVSFTMFMYNNDIVYLLLSSNGYNEIIEFIIKNLDINPLHNNLADNNKERAESPSDFITRRRIRPREESPSDFITRNVRARVEPTEPGPSNQSTGDDKNKVTNVVTSKSPLVPNIERPSSALTFHFVTTSESSSPDSVRLENPFPNPVIPESSSSAPVRPVSPFVPQLDENGVHIGEKNVPFGTFSIKDENTHIKLNQRIISVSKDIQLIYDVGVLRPLRHSLSYSNKDYGMVQIPYTRIPDFKYIAPLKYIQDLNINDKLHLQAMEANMTRFRTLTWEFDRKIKDAGGHIQYVSSEVVRDFNLRLIDCANQALIHESKLPNFYNATNARAIWLESINKRERDINTRNISYND